MFNPETRDTLEKWAERIFIFGCAAVILLKIANVDFAAWLGML